MQIPNRSLNGKHVKVFLLTYFVWRVDDEIPVNFIHRSNHIQSISSIFQNGYFLMSISC